MTKKKNPEDLLKRGRKSIYDPKFCDLIEDALSEGLSVYAACGKVDMFSHDACYKWMKKHPEFADAVARGKRKGALVWEELNLRIARTGVGNSSSVTFGLKNRVPDEWKDKQEVDMNMNVNEISSRITAGRDRLAAMKKGKRNE